MQDPRLTIRTEATLLFNAGYIPTKMQSIVFEDPLELEPNELKELDRWLNMPECQAALPILKKRSKRKKAYELPSLFENQPQQPLKSP